MTDENDAPLDALSAANARFALQSDAAVASLAENGVDPAEFDPSTLQIIGAAFRQENLVGSLFGYETADSTVPFKPLTREQVWDKLQNDRLDAYADKFTGVDNEAEYDRLGRQIKREEEDRQILAASGWTGVAAVLAANVLDPTNLLPGGVGVAAKTAKRTKAALAVGSATAGATAAQELALHATQETRTTEETAISVSSSFLIGGAIGVGIHGLVGRKAADAIVARGDVTLADAAVGYPKARAVGAGVNDEYRALRDQGPDTASAGGVDADFFEWGLKNPLGKSIDQMSNPVIDILDSVSPSARQFGVEFFNVARISKDNALGVPNPESVMDVYKVFKGDMVQTLHEVEQLYRKNKGSYGNSRDEFARRVYRAAVNDDKDADAVVQQAAQVVRNNVFEPIRKSLVESKRLPEEVKLKGALSYVTAIYNRREILRRRPEFQKLIEDGYTTQFESEYADAFKTRETRNASTDKIRGDARFERDFELATRENDSRDALRALSEKEAQELKELETDITFRQVEIQKQYKEKLAAVERTYSDRVAEAKAKTDKDGRSAAQDAAKAFRDRSTDKVDVWREREIKKLQAAEDKQRLQTEAKFKEQRDKISADDAEFGASIRRTADQKLARAGVMASADADKVKAIEAADKSVEETSKRVADLEKFDKSVRDNATKARRALKKATDDKVADTSALQKAVDDAEAAAGDARKFLTEAQKAAKEAEANLTKLLKEPSQPNILKFTTPDARAKLATQSAERFTDRILDMDEAALDYELSTGIKGFLKGRSLPVKQDMLAELGFMNNNVFDVMQRYVRTAGMDAAIMSKFKKTGKAIDAETGEELAEEIGDPTGKSVIDAIRAEYEGPIKGAVGDAAEKLKRERDRTITGVQSALALARGQISHDSGMFSFTGSAAFRKTAEVTKLYNYVRLMGGTVLSSLTDLNNLRMVHGVGRTMRDGVLPLIRNYRTAYLAADSYTQSLSRRTLNAAEFELNGRFAAMAGVDELDNAESSLTRTGRGLGNFFSKWSGITGWNDFLKSINYNVTQARILDASVANYDKLDAREKTWLANLGLDKDGLTKVRAAWESQGTRSQLGISYAEWEKWTGEHAEASKLFRYATTREGANVIITPEIGDLPNWYATPAGQLVLQFRSYAMASQARMLARNAQLSKVAGDEKGITARLGFYTGLLGFLVMAGAVDYSKFLAGNITLTGEPKKNESKGSVTDQYIREWEKRPGRAFYNLLTRSGVAPVLFEQMDSVDKVLAGPLGIPTGSILLSGALQVASGDEGMDGTGSARFRDRGGVDAALGPTFGLLETAPKAFGGAARGTARALGFDAKFDRQDARNIRQLIPFQNAPGIQQILNEGERLLGTANSWPDTK